MACDIRCLGNMKRGVEVIEMSLVENGLGVSEINDIIAFEISEKMKAGKVFTTLELAQDIVDIFKARGMLEVAAQTFINSIILDFVKGEGIKHWKNDY